MSWKNTLQREFPRALRLERLERGMKRALTRRGFSPLNTLFMNGLCREEINRQDVEGLGRFWGDPFDFAGLGGFPSAGLTGLEVCLSSVSETEGRLLLLYGPHVGVDFEGHLGRVLRKNMKSHSPACAAIIKYVDALKQDPDYMPPTDPLDLEHSAIGRLLSPFRKGILESPSPVRTAAESLYEVIETKLDALIDRVAPKVPVALVGGILINTPVASGDYFEPRRAVVRVDGRDDDWLGELDGDGG